MNERENKDQEEPEEKAQEGPKEEKPAEKAQEGPKEEARFVPTEQREEYDSTRRSGEERRESEEPPPDGEERRETPERREGDDRRAMSFGIIYKTAGGMTLIEDWLDDHCQGDWSLVLTGMDDELIQKSFRVMFESETDKTDFIENFIKG